MPAQFDTISTTQMLRQAHKASHGNLSEALALLETWKQDGRPHSYTASCALRVLRKRSAGQNGTHFRLGSYGFVIVEHRETVAA